MGIHQQELRLVLETGQQRVFASAIDWPGWSRAGKKTPDAAVEELLTYRTRYNAVIRLAGMAEIPDPGDDLNVLETVTGDATTDFGAPSIQARAEVEPLTGDELDRQLALLIACWRYLDNVGETVSPELRKGPRGGGRDRDKMLDHVYEAERSYVRKLGVKSPKLAVNDVHALETHRAKVEAALREQPEDDAADQRSWSPRYVIRRVAWHVLDHAWEMEDKDLSGV